MRREEMWSWLTDLDKNERYPIWIISYNRAGHDAPTMELLSGWERKDDINILVRDSQRRDYERAYPQFQIRSLPDEWIDSCGAARWGAVDLALEDGNDSVVMLDDDILQLKFLFGREIMSGPNAGNPCSGVNTREDDEVLGGRDIVSELVVTAMCSVAGDVFAEHPRAVQGGLIKRHGCFAASNNVRKYALNGTVTPRQAMVWNVGRMEKMGIRLNLDHFGVTGEDIGLAAEILSKDGDIFAMPSFVYDHWPESINIHKSTIRNADTIKELNAYELKCLMEYPIRDYLKINRDEDGDYEWGNVNWRALAKIRGTGTKNVKWQVDEEREWAMETLI